MGEEDGKPENPPVESAPEETAEKTETSRAKAAAPRGANGNRRGGKRKGAGRRENVAGYLNNPQSRPESRRHLMFVVNLMLVGAPPPDKPNAPRSKWKKLDPQVGNACLNGLKKVHDEFLTLEQLQARRADNELLERFRRLEEIATALAEHVAEKEGIPADDLLRSLRGGAIQ